MARKRIINFLNIILIVLFFVSFYFKTQMPPPDKILPELMQDPVQTTGTERKDFSFGYLGTDYKVHPVADYELWGIVVSHNDIRAWYNFYWDETAVNIKDLCVVWGENIRNGTYRGMTFKSGEWTCYPGSRFGTDSAFWGVYKYNKLSNNHLLSSDPEVRKIIEEAEVGDQVHFKGLLVDYTEAGGGMRKTSVSRDDTNQTSRSGGACEVVFAEEMEILKKNAPYWHMINFGSLAAFLVLVVFRSVLFLIKNRKYLFKKKRREKI